jgi:AcrR family transcriptional regulator
MTKDDPRQKLVAAAERILIRDGRAGITTRRLAREAGLNHGLVHYHFGSVDGVLAATLDSAGERALARIGAALSVDAPFLERWRTMAAAMEEHIRSGDAKLLAELAAVAINDPRLRERYATVIATWRSLVEGALDRAVDEYRLSPGAVEPAAALVTALVQGIVDERLMGVSAGHAELLQWIEGWLLALEEAPPGGLSPGA